MTDKYGNTIQINDWVKVRHLGLLDKFPGQYRVAQIFSIDPSYDSQNTECKFYIDEIWWGCPSTLVEKITEDEAFLFRLENS